MDKQTLSHYGWIIVMVLTLSVMLAFATPLGKYIGNGVSNIAIAMGLVNDNAVKEDNIKDMGKEWEEYLGGDKLTSSIKLENCYSKSFSYSINSEEFSTVKVYKNGQLFATYSVSNGDIAKGVNQCVFNAGDFKNGDTITIELYNNSNLIGKSNGTYNFIETYALVLDNSSNTNDSRPMIFVRSDTPIAAGNQYTTDKYGTNTVLEVYTGFEELIPSFDTTTYKSNLPWNASASIVTSITVVDKISPISTKGWFSNFTKCHTYNLQNLNTKDVKDMSYMFYGASYDVPETNVDLTYMNVQSATDMTYMFGYFGHNSSTFNLNLSNWKTSNVKSLSLTFYYIGLSSTEFSLNLTDWDTSSLESLYGTFYRAGDMAPKWSLLGIEDWNTSSVTNMNSTFMGCARGAEEFVFDFRKWDTSNVTDMGSMFNQTAYYSPKVIIDCTGWNTSKVTDLSYCFYYIGRTSKSITLTGVSGWNTSSVTNMYRTWYRAGWEAESFYIDVSGWNVSKVTNKTDFNYGVTEKVKSPF